MTKGKDKTRYKGGNDQNRRGLDHTMTKRERTRKVWRYQKRKDRQHNDQKRKDRQHNTKRERTDHTMTKRERTRKVWRYQRG